MPHLIVQTRLPLGKVNILVAFVINTQNINELRCHNNAQPIKNTHQCGIYVYVSIALILCGIKAFPVTFSVMLFSAKDSVQLVKYDCNPNKPSCHNVTSLILSMIPVR